MPDPGDVTNPDVLVVEFDDQTRPHGYRHPEHDDQHWDSSIRAWVDDGLSIMVPPALSEDEISTIELLFRGAVERDERYPLTLAMQPDVDAKLLSFAYHNKSRLQMLATTMRGLMQIRFEAIGTECPYNAATRGEFKFNDWVQKAGEIKRHVERERRRLQARTANRNGATPQERAPAVNLEADLTPQQMIASNAMYLIACGHVLDKRAQRIWYDEFHTKVMTDWECGADARVVEAKALGASEQLSLMRWLMSVEPALSRMGKITVTQTIAHVGYLTRRNCVLEWIESLPEWDGLERLGELMSRGFSTESSEYTKRVGQNWLVSMIARIMEPGCKVDTMPVFYGAQGEAKSMALEIIGGDWYGDATERADAKDFLMKLQGKWLIEIAEMSSVAANKVEMTHVKAMLSRRVDRFRPPYGDTVQEFPRQMVFAGTTNHDDWHTDPTGGRRFNPVKCLGTIDHGWLRECREQLFAEAHAKYRARWEWWKVPEEGHRAALEAQQATGPHDNTIALWLRRGQRDRSLHWDDGTASLGMSPEIRGTRVFAEAPEVASDDPDRRWGNLVTTERIVVQWLGMGMGDVSRVQAAVSAAMLRLGWRRIQTRLGDVRVRHWVCDTREGYLDVLQGDEAPQWELEGV